MARQKPYNPSMVTFLRGSWARNKVIRNFGGNYWGPNRKRCSIMPPEVLRALADDGVIELSDQSFTVKQETK